MKSRRRNPIVDDLTPMQRLFVLEYLKDFNPAAAHSRVVSRGYRNEGNAQRMFRNPRVRRAINEAIAARAKRTGVEADRVLAEISRIALSDMGEFASWGPSGISFVPLEELDPSRTACVEEISETTNPAGGRTLKLKLHSKTKMLEVLMKHLGLLVEKSEISGPNGGPIQTAETGLRQLDANGREALRAALSKALKG